MNKKEITEFFDRLAPEWDTHMITDDAKIAYILDAAGVRKHSIVLDVACGTGVLFPYYLKRDVTRVIGVDISTEMARIAASKHRDHRVEVICGDMECIPVCMNCDCCVVYNAFPHFENPKRLIERLAGWVIPGGRLTIAHGMSLEALHQHHRGRAEHVSREMLTPQSLKEILVPWFEVDTLVSDDGKYVVSGYRRNLDKTDMEQ